MFYCTCKPRFLTWQVYAGIREFRTLAITNVINTKGELIYRTRAWNKEKLNPRQESNPWSPRRTPGGYSIHWATRTHGEQGHFNWVSLITTHDDFDSANPSSMQDRRLSHMNSVKMALLSMTRLKTLVSNLTISLSPMMCQHCSSMFL